MILNVLIMTVNRAGTVVDYIADSNFGVSIHHGGNAISATKTVLYKAVADRVFGRKHNQLRRMIILLWLSTKLILLPTVSVDDHFLHV